LRSIESFPEKAEALVRVSMLSEMAQDTYMAVVRDRARAVAIGI